MTLFTHIPKLCKRGLSIGADGFVILEQSNQADFAWRFFNSDGSTAEMCGNAARCAAKFAYLNGIAGREMAFHTKAGIIKAEIIDDLLVKAELTKPNNIIIDTHISLGNQDLIVSTINTGVPHTVQFVEIFRKSLNVQALGNKIRNHKRFLPEGTNVDFCKIIDNNNIMIRTYERGVENETLACGTGALAAAVISKEKGFVDYPINVKIKSGGTITISFENNSYYINAEARLVYKVFYREAYLY